MDLRIAVKGAREASARLYYRHVNQTERFQTAEMELRESAFWARIPADYTDSPYPLIYYFELREGPERAWLYPGFGAGLLDQPYFVLPRA